jgi:hypothetical protein
MSEKPLKLFSANPLSLFSTRLSGILKPSFISIAVGIFIERTSPNLFNKAMTINVHERHHQATIAVIILALLAIILGVMEGFS